MKILPFVLISLFFVPSASWAASPETPSPQDIRPVYETDGALRFCLADSLYPDARKISFAYSRKEEINIGLTIPKGNFIKARRYDLDLALEGKSPRKVRAIAISDDTLLLEMGASPSFVNTLKKSSLLTISANGKDMLFPLPVMDSLLMALQECTQAPTETASLPETPTPPPAPPQEKLDSPQNILSFLTKAGLRDVSLVPQDDVPLEERVADYVWETGSVMGGIRQETVPEEIALAELVGLHLKGLREKCEGSFKTDIQKEQTSATALLRYAQASCSFEEDKTKPAVIVSLLFSLTPNHVFYVFTHEGLENKKPEILSARDKIGQLLMRSPL